jgi:hypothetical protein
MAMTLAIIGIFILLVWIYIFFAREWFVAKFPDQFSVIHRIEDKLWDRSRTLLAARVYWMGGLILFIHDSIAQSGYIDWQPIIGQVAEMFPESWRPLVGSMWPVATGVLFEALRWMTTQSVEGNRQEEITKIEEAVEAKGAVENNPATRSDPNA